MNLDFNKICRLCLRFCKKSYDLSASNGVKNGSFEIMEAIKTCYCLQIDVNDGLPTRVCQPCVKVLHYFCMSKKNVIVSDQLLRNVLFLKNKTKAAASEESQILNCALKAEPYNISEKVLIRSPPKVQFLVNVGTPPVTETRPELENSTVLDISNDKSLGVSLNESNRSNVEEKTKKTHSSNRELQRQSQKRLRRLLTTASSPNTTSTAGDKGRKNTSEETKTSTEKIVKVIGTVIDESNILSPDVKRSRKSTFNKNIEN